MKTKEKDHLRLMQWAKDRYPPIDMNNQVKHVIDLIHEVTKLRQAVKNLTIEIENHKQVKQA